MKSTHSVFAFNFCLTAVLAVLLFSVANVAAQKLKVEDVIAKHLESIGTAQNRAVVKNRISVGVSSFKLLRQSAVTTNGNAVIASEANKFLIGMSFTASEYALEKIGYDGKKLKAAYIRPGVRSALGNFVLSMEKVNRQGLLGGVLTDSWSLFNMAEHKPILEYDGTKKINNIETHVLGYTPRGGSDFKIKLYFDAQNFRHIRTEYLRVLSAAQGLSPETSSQQRESRQQLVEDFSNFKTFNNYTLPQTYRLTLTFEGLRDASEYEWRMDLSQFLFNQQLDPKSFDVEAK